MTNERLKEFLETQSMVRELTVSEQMDLSLLRRGVKMPQIASEKVLKSETEPVMDPPPTMDEIILAQDLAKCFEEPPDTGMGKKIIAQVLGALSALVGPILFILLLMYLFG